MQVLAILLALVGIARAFQQPLFVAPSDASEGSAPFRGVGDLSSVASGAYTHLAHPSFPRHSVRVKESRFCDGGVRAYTGYIDIAERHLFFYFFESRNDPATDDVILWTNGGPGSSSSMGLFMELGPCRVTGDNSTERFEYAWNERANVFFIDQPVGVGFSYADHGEPVGTTFEAAHDVVAFVTIFFEHFSQFKGRPFHLAGESYGGRYLPVFGSSMYDNNAKLVEAGLTPINLSSVMIGNGCVNFLTMLPAWYDAVCMPRRDFGFDPLFTIEGCVAMKQHVPRCEKRLKEHCIDTFDKINCWNAFDFCGNSMSAYYNADGGRNYYDRTRPCKGHSMDVDCYTELKNITTFLNLPTTQSILGVDPNHSVFEPANDDVWTAFQKSADHVSFNAEYHLAALLERGVRVLVYAGANDLACNWIGLDRMTFDLEWSENHQYRSQPFREWVVDGEVAGKVRAGGGLTFVTILDAGHLAPYDQPVRSLEIANRWLEKKDI